MKSLWGPALALKAARRIKRVPAGMVATNPERVRTLRAVYPEGHYADGRRDRRRYAGW